jgi:hypothetical protein
MADAYVKEEKTVLINGLEYIRVNDVSIEHKNIDCAVSIKVSHVYVPKNEIV